MPADEACTVPGLESIWWTEGGGTPKRGALTATADGTKIYAIGAKNPDYSRPKVPVENVAINEQRGPRYRHRLVVEGDADVDRSQPPWCVADRWQDFVVGGRIGSTFMLL